MEVSAGMPGPQHFPQPHDIREAEFPLEEDQKPAKAKVEVAGIVIVQVLGQVRVDEGD